MIVKCICNDYITSLGQDSQYYSDFAHLELGKCYVVYAVYAKKTLSFHIWGGPNIPDQYPSYLFEIVDPRVSKYWVCGTYSQFDDDNILKNIFSIFSYPQWALEYYEFWDKFVDGDKKINKQFQSYKELMDKEYQDPDIELHAVTEEPNWVKCPVCINIWEPGIEFETISCPECSEVLINDLAMEYNKSRAAV